MSSPKRIQMSRQCPWRAENAGAVIVARPSKWGNPYRVDAYRADYPDADLSELRRMAVSDFAGMLAGDWGEEHDYPLVDDLAGRDLACWCPLDQPCHADVLLEVANGVSPATQGRSAEAS